MHRGLAGLKRSGAALAAAAAATALAGAPVAQAAPKPQLKLTQSCPIAFGQQTYGVKVTGKHLPPNSLFDLTISALRVDGIEMSLNDTVLMTDAKGRFVTRGHTDVPLVTVAASASALFPPEWTAVARPISSPCS